MLHFFFHRTLSVAAFLLRLKRFPSCPALQGLLLRPILQSLAFFVCLPLAESFILQCLIVCNLILHRAWSKLRFNCLIRYQRM